MEEPEFQVVELKYAHPESGARFWIEWLVEKEFEEEQEIEVEVDSWINFFLKKIGMKPRTRKEKALVKKIKKIWEIFNDPASTEINKGYVTMNEATYAIERYLINMRPIIHKYNKTTHSK